jgi:pimeloyl-ACP methyl ester carboxylesterase
MIAATTIDELPVFFPARDGTLLGVLTGPRGPVRGVGVVVLSGGGTPLSTNVNRLSVRLCRQASESGFHAFRFDYHGVGESEGVSDRFDLAKPFVGDVEGALAFLRSRGIERFVLIGSCFGARTALGAAAIMPDIEGLVLISPPVRDFEMGDRIATRLATELSLWGYARKVLRWRNLRRFRRLEGRQLYSKLVRAKLRAIGRRDARSATADPRCGVSRTFVQEFGEVVRKGTQILMIFGNEDDLWMEFERAHIPEAMRHADALAVKVLPGVVHGFTDLGCQEAVLDRIHRWLDGEAQFAGRSWGRDAGSTAPESTDPVGT